MLVKKILLLLIFNLSRFGSVLRRFLKKIKEFEKKYPDENNVPRPPHWSGWRVLPNEIEFWVDGEGRIHERLNYKNKNGKWEKGKFLAISGLLVVAGLILIDGSTLL